MIAYPNSILECTNIIQLSEFITHMVPKIWTGTPFKTNSRTNLFKSFCQNMLKATQISNSCILVALFYICRLRCAYPTIRGSIGSEVRLFTTALVLANKFLDDNTFTNKTWSEVSSIPLNELNIMEMEFLSALQYRTSVHHLQFFSWTAQCQQWMNQLPNSSNSNSKNLKNTHNKKNAYHPYSKQHSAALGPILSWTSSSSSNSSSYSSFISNNSFTIPIASVSTNYFPTTAASVAAEAAATAMNSSFIPRV